MHEILHFPVKVIKSKVLFVAQLLWDKEENMMSNTNDLLNRINNCYSSMSKGQKMLATYITDNYDKAVFGVSESTVVRFATYLGYKGYPEFQRALEELVRNKLNSVQRMEVTYGRISQSKILETVLSADADKIKTTLEKIDHSAFEVAVSTILEAKNIYIVGIRSCAPLASFLGFYLNLMFDNVRLLTTNSSSELFEQMVRIGENDVIIGISFPRYSMRTLKALEFANNRSAKVITITDSIHSPMNLYSSCNLIADSGIHCGFPCRTAFRYQCAGSGSVHEETERSGGNTDDVRRHLG